MIPLVAAGLLVSSLGWLIYLYRRGGWGTVLSFVLTAVVICGVVGYAIVPADKGLPAKRLVGLIGGPFAAASVSGIPAAAWFLVSLKHRRGTLAGHVYAVVYAVAVGLCFLPAGLLAAACYFPAVARTVLGRIADALPGRDGGA
jgi:hypothetical protein